MIVNRLKALCDELGLGAVEAGEICGLPRSTFGHLHRNEASNVSFNTLEAICEGLSRHSKHKINVNDFLYYVEDVKATKEERRLADEREGKAEHIRNLRAKR